MFGREPCRTTPSKANSDLVKFWISRFGSPSFSSKVHRDHLSFPGLGRATIRPTATDLAFAQTNRQLRRGLWLSAFAARIPGSFRPADGGLLRHLGGAELPVDYSLAPWTARRTGRPHYSKRGVLPSRFEAKSLLRHGVFKGLNSSLPWFH